jgi:hypothetical protein
LQLAKPFCSLQNSFAACKTLLQLAKPFCSLQNPFVACKTLLQAAKIEFYVKIGFFATNEPILAHW